MLEGLLWAIICIGVCGYEDLLYGLELAPLNLWPTRAHLVAPKATWMETDWLTGIGWEVVWFSDMFLSLTVGPKN